MPKQAIERSEESSNVHRSYDLGILHGSWRWAGCPYPSQYHHRASVSVESLGDSRRIRPLCEQRPERSRRVRHLQCSDPWPSCFQLLIGQRRSCPVGRVDRMGQNALNPWCRAPNRRALHVEHIYHLDETITMSSSPLPPITQPYPQLRCSRRWCVPIADRNHHGMYQLGQYHVHLRWLPRTTRNSFPLSIDDRFVQHTLAPIWLPHWPACTRRRREGDQFRCLALVVGLTMYDFTHFCCLLLRRRTTRSEEKSWCWRKRESERRTTNNEQTQLYIGTRFLSFSFSLFRSLSNFHTLVLGVLLATNTEQCF